MLQTAIANLKCKLIEAAADRCYNKIYGFCKGEDLQKIYAELKLLQSNCELSFSQLNKYKIDIISNNQ